MHVISGMIHKKLLIVVAYGEGKQVRFKTQGQTICIPLLLPELFLTLYCQCSKKTLNINDKGQNLNAS